MIRAINRLIAPLARQLASLATRAVVELVDDSRRSQKLQVSIREDEVRDAVEYLQPAGFKSVPLPGMDCVLLAIGGDADHRLALTVADRDRPVSWQPGDVGIYHLVTGDMIWFRADGAVEITASKKLRITAPELELVGNLTVSGRIADHTGSLDSLRAVFNSHTHGNTPTPTGSM